MGRKSVLKSYLMINAGDMSADITSNATSVINLDKLSIHLTWSGSSPSGNFYVQARNGENADWYNLDFGSTITVSGSPGEHIINLNELPFTDIRLFFDRTSGTGTMNARITGKTTGA